MWWREPLVHFIVAGLALFAWSEARHEVDTTRIIVTPEREAYLARRYALQFGTRPDSVTLAQLTERDVAEEMLFRRGLEIGLDRDDEIVRRRIVQKMQFLLEDTRAPIEPSEAEMSAYYAAHASNYTVPRRATFTHVYFAASADDRADRGRAIAALDALARDRIQPHAAGDAFPDSYFFASYEPEQVRRLFGRSEFADAVFTAPLDRWMGPLRSGMGWHLLRVAARQEAQRQSFAEVRDRVRTDYLREAQERANEASFAELARSFTVIRKGT